MLAEVAGCSPGNFSDKINENPGHRFTDIQKDKITAFLKKLAKAAAKIKIIIVCAAILFSCSDSPDRPATSGDNYFIGVNGDTVPVTQGHIEVPTTFRKRNYEDSLTGFKVTYVGTANCRCSCNCCK